MTAAELPASGAIQLISRAASLLRCLEGEPEGLSLSQLAERAALPRSTVHRLLAALEVEGFVVPTPPRGYMKIGPVLRRIAGGGRADLVAALRPTMQSLFDELDETIDLAILADDHLRFVDQILAPHRLRAVSAVGATFPLHCTANGKAVLALMDAEEREAALAGGLDRYTEATITDRDALEAELDVVRVDGVAIDRGEHTAGVHAAGFAVRDAFGRYLAVSVPMPSSRFEGREALIRDRLTGAATALRIGAAIG